MRTLPMVLLLAALSSGTARAQTVLVSGGDNAIHKLSQNGRDLGVFATTGLDGPAGMALDRAGNVHVACTGNNTVRFFSPSGHYLGLSASGGLNSPTSVAFDRSGNLYVANMGDNTVRKFAPGGQSQGVVLSLLGIGCPGALAFDHAGNLLVTDPCADVIRRVSPKGQTMAVFGAAGLRGPNAIALDGDFFVANTGEGGGFGRSIHRFSPMGQDRGAFVALKVGFPGGIAFDRGQLLVADQVQRGGQIDYAIRRFSMSSREAAPLVVPYQPRSILVMPHARGNKD
jgi:hypothetical protein